MGQTYTSMQMYTSWVHPHWTMHQSRQRQNVWVHSLELYTRQADNWVQAHWMITTHGPQVSGSKWSPKCARGNPAKEQSITSLFIHTFDLYILALYCTPTNVDKMVSLTDTETVQEVQQTVQDTDLLLEALHLRQWQICSVVEMRSLLSWTSYDWTNMGQIHSHTKMRGFYCAHTWT